MDNEVLKSIVKQLCDNKAVLENIDGHIINP